LFFSRFFSAGRDLSYAINLTHAAFGASANVLVSESSPDQGFTAKHDTEWECWCATTRKRPPSGLSVKFLGVLPPQYVCPTSFSTLPPERDDGADDNGDEANDVEDADEAV